MTLPRSHIDKLHKAINLLLSDGSERTSFGNKLTQQSVRVLVSSSLPGVIGIGEVDINGKITFQSLVFFELNTIVIRHGTSFLPGDTLESFGRDLAYVFSRGMTDLVSEEKPTLSFHVGENMLGLFFADDRISFPVSNPRARFDNEWSCINTLLLALLSAFFPDFCTISATIPAFATTQELLELRFPHVDILIDRFVTDRFSLWIFSAHTSGNLFG